MSVVSNHNHADVGGFGAGGARDSDVGGEIDVGFAGGVGVDCEWEECDRGD